MREIKRNQSDWLNLVKGRVVRKAVIASLTIHTNAEEATLERLVVVASLLKIALFRECNQRITVWRTIDGSEPGGVDSRCFEAYATLGDIMDPLMQVLGRIEGEEKVSVHNNELACVYTGMLR